MSDLIKNIIFTINVIHTTSILREFLYEGKSIAITETFTSTGSNKQK